MDDAGWGRKMRNGTRLETSSTNYQWMPGMNMLWSSPVQLQSARYRLSGLQKSFVGEEQLLKSEHC